LRKNKRVLFALMVGAVVFAAAFGMAASLGGITSEGLGADDSVVASCDTDGVSTAYVTVYNATGSGSYKVDSVTVSGINNACDGKAIQVTLSTAADASLEGVTSTVPTDGAATSMSLNFADTTVAESVTGVHIVISG